MSDVLYKDHVEINTESVATDLANVEQILQKIAQNGASGFVRLELNLNTEINLQKFIGSRIYPKIFWSSRMRNVLPPDWELPTGWMFNDLRNYRRD